MAINAPAFAQMPVLMRAWERGNAAQLSFDWPRAVPYSSAVEGDRLTVKFSDPMVANISPISRLAPNYFSGGRISADGTEVTLILKQKVRVTSYARNDRIIFELEPAGNAANSTLVDMGAVGADGPPRAANQFPQRAGANLIADGNRPATDAFGNLAPLPPTLSEDGRYLVRIEDTTLTDNTVELHFIWPTSIAYSVTKFNGNVDIRFSKQGNIEREQLLEHLPEWLKTPVIANQNGGTAILLNMTQPHELEYEKRGNRIIIRFVPPEVMLARKRDSVIENRINRRTLTTDEIQTARAVVSGDLSVKSMSMEQARDILVQAGELDPDSLEAEEDAQLDTENVIGKTLVNLQYIWPNQVGGAIFRRGEYIWIIFDESTIMDMEPLRGENQDVIVNIEQLPMPNFTIFRLLVPDLRINPALRREGNIWQVDLRLGPSQPARPLFFDVNINADLGPHLTLPSQEPGEHLSVTDPATGDVLNVITYRESGLGVLGQRNYPEFIIIPSVQGLAMISLSQDMNFVKADDGFNISGNDGLHLSGVSPNIESETTVGFKTENLFDFKDWAQGPPDEYYQNKQRLLRTVSEMPEDDLARARLYLARFYVAHNLGPEALGVLSLMAKDHTDLMEAPPVIALRGAANLLAGRLEEAEQDLGNGKLDQYREASLWRGALLAKQGEMREASQFFSFGTNQLRDYPQPLKGEIGLLMIEAAMDNRNIRLATGMIDQLDREEEFMTRGNRGDLLYHKARMMASRADYELANDWWQELMVSDDRKNAARSTLAYVNLNLRQETISAEEALSLLEDLRYQWRGDQFELAVLEQLGNMYISNGLYQDGFEAFKTALSYFPNESRTKVIATRMQDTFKNLFLNDQADKLDPLLALALYDAYRELTPPGPEGDVMISKLVDRLVGVDMLDRAARLLEYQIDNRLDGLERVQAGTRLAMIRLLERKPLDTLVAIQKTNDIVAPDLIMNERRRLSARAHFALNDSQEALKLLAGDVSEEANLLRRDIYWKNQSWSEVAKNLQRLAGKPPERTRQAMPEDRARHVIDWAVALRLDKDIRGLAFLKQNYSTAMGRTEMADLFDYLTESDFETELPEDSAAIEAYVNQLTGRGEFDDFLNNYRERIL
ncbi:MAG: tetratricopeptide repeat protein [Alphaproteobacteria bacterium]